MQKWEYLKLEWSGKWYQNGNELVLAKARKLQGPEFIDYLNELGNQGWELISTRLAYDVQDYFFKRPKP